MMRDVALEALVDAKQAHQVHRDLVWRGRPKQSKAVTERHSLFRSVPSEPYNIRGNSIVLHLLDRNLFSSDSAEVALNY